MFETRAALAASERQLSSRFVPLPSLPGEVELLPRVRLRGQAGECGVCNEAATSSQPPRLQDNARYDGKTDQNSLPTV